MTEDEFTNNYYNEKKRARKNNNKIERLERLERNKSTGVVLQRRSSSSSTSQIVSGGATGSTDHNDLSNLQGGTSDEYYHLTSDEYTNELHTEDEIKDIFDNEVLTMIEGIETGRETKTSDGVTSTLDMSSSSFEDVWCQIIKGTTGYTSATVEVQVCDTDSAVDAEWETIFTFTLSTDETEYYSKRISASYARAKLSSFVGTDIIINLGATV